METVSVYNRLGVGYLTPGRNSTTSLFRSLQHGFIRQELNRIRERNALYYSDMHILIVGAGPIGNIEEIISQHALVGAYLDEVDPVNVTYIDSSPVVLRACQDHVTSRTRELTKRENVGCFLLGKAEALSEVVSHGTFDVVIGALCDHFDQAMFFESAHRTLVSGGALITTYPSEKTNRIIREQIYGIGSSFTRFMVDGVAHLVPSTLMTEDRLSFAYEEHGFVQQYTKELFVPKEDFSDTVAHAVQLTGKNDYATLLVGGVGYKA